jgi:hypothetical protein
MTDKELVRKLFPTPIRKELKRVLAELNQDGPKPRKLAGKTKKR